MGGVGCGGVQTSVARGDFKVTCVSYLWLQRIYENALTTNAGSVLRVFESVVFCGQLVTYKIDE